jgi:hypothetical protein
MATSTQTALEDSKQAIASAGEAAGANGANIELPVEGTAGVEPRRKIPSYYRTKEFYLSILLGLATCFGIQLLAPTQVCFPC